MLRLVLVGLLVPAAASAGTIDGTVIDASTLEPVGGVVIAGEGKPVKSNAAGRFTIKDTSGPITLVGEKQGYDPGTTTVRVPAIGRVRATILLYPLGSSGDVVEIVDETPPIEPIAPGTQQLSRKELTRIPGTRGDALTSIKSLPGVGTIDGQSASPGVLVIRGAAPEDSVVTVDGIQVPLLYHFFGLQSIIPSELIQTINFQPGGFGVENGRATGGLIEIRTRADDAKTWNGFAELSFINLAAFVSGPIWAEKNLYLTAGARRSTIDFILPAVLPDDANLDFTTAPQYYDAQLRVDWIPSSKHRLTVLGLASWDLLTLLNDNINPNEPDFTGKFDNETQFTRAITTWRFEHGNMSNALVTSVGTTGFRVEVGVDNLLQIDSFVYELRDDFSWRPRKWFNLRAGVQGLVDTADLNINFPLPPQEGDGGPTSFSNSPRITRMESITNTLASAYIAADFQPFAGFRVSPGIRVDYFGRIDEFDVLPRIQFEQEFSDKLTLKSSIGMYSRPLDGPESLQTNLVSEKAVQLVMGPKYDFTDGISASVNGFYTWRTDLVTQDAMLAETDINNSYVSRGFGRSYGAELLLRARRENFFGWIAYTYSRSDRVDGQGMPRRLFDFDQTHVLTALGSYTYGTWEFGARFQLSSGRPDTPVEGSLYLADVNAYIPVYGQVNSTRLNTGHQLDIRIDKKFEFDSWKLALYLDITNVYANPRTLNFRYNYDFTKREAITDLPILPAIGVRGTF